MEPGCDLDINTFNYPPLFQDMRLSTKGGPLYRGGRGGRATAAYYREREAVIAAKMKYGRRYGRHVQAYKPETDMWKTTRHQRSFEVQSCTFEFIPGGLQEWKYSVQDELSTLTKSTARSNQQDTDSLKSHRTDKPSSAMANQKPSAKTLSTSNFQNPEVKRFFRGGRGVMRGRRIIDVAAVSSSVGEKTDTSPYGDGSILKKEPRHAAIAGSKNTKEHMPNQFSSQLIKLVETMSIH